MLEFFKRTPIPSLHAKAGYAAFALIFPLALLAQEQLAAIGDFASRLTPAGWTRANDLARASLSTDVHAEQVTRCAKKTSG